MKFCALYKIKQNLVPIFVRKGDQLFLFCFYPYLNKLNLQERQHTENDVVEVASLLFDFFCERMHFLVFIKTTANGMVKTI